jgi:hypothetical protein
MMFPGAAALRSSMSSSASTWSGLGSSRRPPASRPISVLANFSMLSSGRFARNAA